MIFTTRLRRTVLTLALILAACQSGEAASVWKDASIGTQPEGVGHTVRDGLLTITGGGMGLDHQGADQCQFVHQRRAAGDFQVIARLASFDGTDAAMAGIMVRSQDSAANGAMVATYLQAKDNFAGWKSRIPGSKETPRMFAGGIKLVEPAPIWLKLIRMGGNFAVYKSRDGQHWAMVSNVSGGPVALDGPLDVGFFVASAAADKTATATFDHIAIGDASMPYRTSWVGNTFGSRHADSHVSNGLSAMWVAPDGTCYTSAYWDEGGQPVKAYRDGKVVGSLPINTPQTYEGAITGEGQYVYVAAVDRIVQFDTKAADFAPRTLTLAGNLMDKEKDHSVVTGMAADADTLFAADSRENRIRVVSLRNPTYHVATAANDGTANAPGPVQLPKDEPRLAPALVYQSQRVGEGFKYTIPGCEPGATYRIRCHFAEFKEQPPDSDPRNSTAGLFGEIRLNVAELAGGAMKALVQDFDGKVADDKGEIHLDYGSYGPGLCGFEVFSDDGKRVFAVNCGGPPVGDFKGEANELPEKGFAFERPGAMAFDKRGDLWVIQRGNDHPMSHGMTAKHKAAVLCYGRDGKPTGRRITDVVNPRGLGYDPVKDELLVAENGPDMNIRIYGALDTAPVLARTFGKKGGIYAGKNPGLINDPQAGGYARFAGVAGVGVDSKGNLYVGGGFQGADLRQFLPDGSLGWMLNSLVFCNTYAVDPDSDGSEIYTTYHRLHLDLEKTEPGSEQTYMSFNWDHRRFGEAPGAGGSQAMMGRLGPERRLVMVTSGQGAIGDVNIFRYEAHLAIPAGGTRKQGSSLWIDANGDGLMTDDECTDMQPAISSITSICLDSKGDLWASIAGSGGSIMRHFRFKGFNAHQVPIYGTIKGEDYEDVAYPEEGATTSGWGMASRMDYDADRDIMIAFYPLVARTGEGDRSPGQYALARYDRWSTGNREPTWKIKAFTPQTDPDYFMYERDLFPYAGYMGMHMAGDYVFLAYLFGEVHAFDLKTGKLAQTLPMGPEVNGQCAWEDATMGLRAFKCKDGEYLIFTENSGWGGKNNFFRWRP